MTCTSLRLNALLFALLIGPAMAMPASEPNTVEEDWALVLLADQKVGHLQTVRTQTHDRVITQQHMLMKLSRGGVALELSTSEQVTESLNGEVTRFESRQSMAGGEIMVEGEVNGGQATAITRSAGTQSEQTFDWPADVVMSEGLRLMLEREPLQAGDTMTFKTFIPGSLAFAESTVRVGQVETVDVLGIERSLRKLTQDVRFGAQPTRMVTWVDEDFATQKMSMSILGMQFEMLTCPKACALGDFEPVEFFAQTFMRSPRGLQPRRHPQMTYTLRSGDGKTLQIPTSAEQSVSQNPDGSIKVTVRVEPPAVDDAMVIGIGQDNAYIQASAPLIIQLAQEAIGIQSDALSRMRTLERFVRNHVVDKNLAVGYASALEVARSRSGDCTEHAVLLAALGRAVGVPTRIATGLAYVDDYLSAQHVFVPHAWTQAFVNGRWQSFDAALPGFDAGHIALAYGDGDPINFYDSAQAIGRIELLRAQP